MCIEDKLFTKANSFIKGERQGLAQIDEVFQYPDGGVPGSLYQHGDLGRPPAPIECHRHASNCSDNIPGTINSPDQG
jgi:hypothetical protein